MEREKQIEEMARVYDEARYKAQETLGSMNEGAGLWYARAFYTAGYRKVEQGEWKHPPYAPFGGSYEMKRCSVCGYKPDFDSDNPYTKFCPNCGAKMKGAENA